MSDQKNVFFYHFIYYKMFSQNMRLGKKKKKLYLVWKKPFKRQTCTRARCNTSGSTPLNFSVHQMTDLRSEFNPLL